MDAGLSFSRVAGVVSRGSRWSCYPGGVLLGSLSRSQTSAPLSISLCARSIASRPVANSPVLKDLYRPVPTLISKSSVRWYSVAAVVEFSRQADKQSPLTLRGCKDYPPAKKTYAPFGLRAYYRCPLPRTTRARPASRKSV